MKSASMAEAVSQYSHARRSRGACPPLGCKKTPAIAAQTTRGAPPTAWLLGALLPQGHEVTR